MFIKTKGTVHKMQGLIIEVKATTYELPMKAFNVLWSQRGHLKVLEPTNKQQAAIIKILVH